MSILRKSLLLRAIITLREKIAARELTNQEISIKIKFEGYRCGTPRQQLIRVIKIKILSRLFPAFPPGGINKILLYTM